MVSHSYRSQTGTRVPNLDSWQTYNDLPACAPTLVSVRSVRTRDECSIGSGHERRKRRSRLAKNVPSSDGGAV